jgi:hypothetical protein
MTLSELINEILSEWGCRVDNGMPNPKNPQHLRELRDVLEVMGLSSIKNELIGNLLEGDNFKNPALNKVISYKSVNGEDAEGKVGNLLRRPKEEDAYKQAVATLGGEDSDTYKKAMDDLGGEGQPEKKDEKEKGDKGDAAAEKPQTPNSFDKTTKGGTTYLKGLPDTDPAKPDSMKDDSEETLSAGGVVYPVGGGYYADSPGGVPKYRKATEESVDKMDFRYILESENLVGTQVVKKVAGNGGETVSLVVVGDVKDNINNLKISDKVIETNIAKAAKHIDNSNADEATKKVLKDSLSKILKGEDVSSDNLEISKKWLAVRVGGGNDVGIYIAKTEGDFVSNSRESIKMEIPKSVEDVETKADGWNDSIVNKYGLPIKTQTGSFVNKKDLTAAKMNKQRRKVEITSSENSVTMDGVEYQKRSIPDKNELVSSFIKKGYSEKEANSSADKIIASVERRNRVIDELSKSKEMEVVEYGLTDTDENRKKTLNNVISNTKEGILKSIKKYSGLSDDEIRTKYADLIDSIDKLESSAPINNPNWNSMSVEEKETASKEYMDNLVNVLQNIRRDSDLASGGPDLAEVIVFMGEIGKGNQAFLPSSSNFPTVDIISLSEQKTPDPNLTPNELSEFYANEFSSNSVSFIDSDADSIKLGKGGASAGHKKSQGSTFNNEKTAEALDSLMDCYSGTFGPYPPSKEGIDKAEETYNKTRAYLKDVLIKKGYSPEQAERMIADKEKNGVNHYEQAKKSYQNSLGGEVLNPEFDRGLQIYNKAGNLFEMLYNQDLKSNEFGNVRFIESGSGPRTKISIETLDGINEKCCVKFNPNPGELKIKGAGGARTAGINVSFSTWIEKCK